MNQTERPECQIGPGLHECHWCARLVGWKDEVARLVADHVNGDKLDNRPENLVPSCDRCNLNRGKQGNPALYAPRWAAA